MSVDDEKTGTGSVRLSIKLSADAAEAIREISERRGITITEVIRRAISTHKYIDDASARGAKVLVREPDKTVSELVFVL
jgi:hypothetical protein